MLMAKQGQKLLRVGAAAHELGLHPMTVRRWIKAGRIGVVQVGREVRIPRSEIERIVGSIEGRLVVLYGRVSGHGQKDDLETQLKRLQAWAKTERKGQETLVLSDIGSGLKAGREGRGPAWLDLSWSGSKVVFERHCSWGYTRASTVAGGSPAVVRRVWPAFSSPAYPREPCPRRGFSCPGFPSLVAPQELCR